MWGVREKTHTLLCDDLTLFAQTDESGYAVTTRGSLVSLRIRIQIGMFRPIRVDHTNCLQVAIKTSSWIALGRLKKCCVMRVGGQHSEECKHSQIKYRG
jgi:hypothetical protein